MKLKKILGGLVLCLLCILTVAVLDNKPTDAAEKVITLSMNYGKKTHTYDLIDVHIALKESDIKKVEIKEGKIKSTANKKWKNSTVYAVYECDDDPNCSSCSHYVDTNGYYTVRVTTTSGKKYVKSIKVKNLLNNCYLSQCYSQIKNISKADNNGNYTLTADVYSQLGARVDDVLGKKVGDTIIVSDTFMFEEFECTITDVIRFDGYGEPEHLDTVEDYSCRPVLTTEYCDLFTEYFKDDPYFGLVFNNTTGAYFMAYDDFAWDDCYSEFCCLISKDAQFLIDKKTLVFPANYDMQKYGFRYTIDAETYIALRGNKKKQQKLGIIIYDSLDCRLYMHYDSKTDAFTNYLDEIFEIYSP